MNWAEFKTSWVMLMLVVGFVLNGCGNEPAVPTKKLIEAATQGDPGNVEGNLYYKIDKIDDTDHEGMTALHHAAKMGHTHIVAILLKHEAPLELEDVRKNRPLHLAVLANKPQVVKQLVDAGADVDAAGEKGETALAKAIEFGYDEVLAALIAGGVDTEKTSGQVDRSGLWLAANYGRQDVTAVLIEAGAKVDAITDIPPRRTVLIQAVFRGQADIARKLVAAGADMTVKDATGRTAADYAKQQGRNDILEILGETKAATAGG